jgi:hypothetical protein
MSVVTNGVEARKYFFILQEIFFDRGILEKEPAAFFVRVDDVVVFVLPGVFRFGRLSLQG